MKKKSPIFLVIFVVLIAFSFVTNGFYKLDNAEKAVIERFGELIKVVDKPGLSFKIPYLDKVYIINTNKVESIQYGYRPDSAPTPTSEPSYINKDDESIVLTKGSYIVNIGAIIQYRITDPAAYIYNVDDQLGTARLAFESVLRRNMQNRDLESALIYKESIALEILPELSKKLNSYGLGITITDVKFTDVLLPENVQLAYDDVNIAENEKTEYKSKADKYTNEMLPNARADAYQRIQEAESYKANKLAQANGDVENFLQVYEKYKVAKDITKERLYIETMESVLSKVNSKFIIDFNSDGVVKYLPLSPDALSKGGN